MTREDAERCRRGFNEARAFSAGNLHADTADQPRAMASMRPAHSAREIVPTAERVRRWEFASMRPAHSAREISAAARMESLSGI